MKAIKEPVEIELATLEADALSPLPQPPLDEPPQLPLSQIERMPSVFQTRLGADAETGVASDEFAGGLLQDLTRSGSALDALGVWWSGKRWVLVDGHHRMAAYEKHDTWRSKPVPVHIIRGNRSVAYRASVEENSKRHLNMTATDRTNSAWQLVCLSLLSKAETAEVAKVSESTVRNQRRRLAEVLEAAPDEHSRESLSRVPWREVSRKDFLGSTTNRDVDPVWLEKLARNLANRLGREFGGQLIKNPDAFAMAIRMHSENLPQMLMDSKEWSDLRDPLVAAWAEEIEDRDNEDF